MFWVNKSLKIQGGSHRSNLIGQEIKYMTCGWSYSMCSIRGCAPLERWHIPKRGSQPLERWHPLISSKLTCGELLQCWERWQPTPIHLASFFIQVVRPPCLLGAPSSIGIVTHLVIIWSFLPLDKLVRVLGRIVLVSLYHSWIGIKKALEANLVWIHVWLLIVMCKFMRWHCFISFVYANLLNLVFVGILLLMKDRIINLIWFLIPIDYLF